MNNVKMMRGFSEDMHNIPASVSDVKRRFEFYDILWKIEHFNLATCPTNWLIHGPEIIVRGSDFTKWSMSLESGEKQNSIPVFNLERCDLNAGPKTLNAEWRLIISLEDQTFHGVDRFSAFNEGTTFQEPLNDFAQLFETLNFVEIDVLAIKCFLIIYDDDNIGHEFQPCDDVGKKLLSKNLLNLHEIGIGSDLALIVDNKTIMAHKAILCTRIPELNLLLELEKCDERNVVHLSLLKYEAVLSVIDYIYSGDLTHILCEPSLAIFDCVQTLDIQHLRKYYEPKKLNIRSTLEYHEFQLTWEIANFFEKYKTFETPVILDDIPWTWQLQFSPEDENRNDYYSVFLKSIGETKITNLCVEFAVLNDLGMTLFVRKLRCSTDDLSTIGFTKFIRRSLLRNLSKCGKNLQLGIKIQLTNDTLSTSVEKYDIMLVTNTNQLNSFDLLSLDMQMLYKTSDFSDLQLCYKNHNFALHRCILNARRGYFATSLANSVSDNFLTIPETELDMQPETACVLFLYLYSGILGTEDYETLKDLRAAAVKCNLPVLKDMCENALRQNLSNGNK